MTQSYKLIKFNHENNQKDFINHCNMIDIIKFTKNVCGFEYDTEQYKYMHKKLDPIINQYHGKYVKLTDAYILSIVKNIDVQPISVTMINTITHEFIDATDILLNNLELYEFNSKDKNQLADFKINLQDLHNHFNQMSSISFRKNINMVTIRYNGIIELRTGNENIIPYLNLL